MGWIKVSRNRIELTLENSQPTHSAPYRGEPKAREFEHVQIEKMLLQERIAPAQTEWAASMVFAPKKDGSLRFCVDNRRMNAATKQDLYPIPRLDECIGSLGEAAVLSSFDTNNGYWQVEVDVADRNNSDFISIHGLFRFVRMQLGLKNKSETFQRAMNDILSLVKW